MKPTNDEKLQLVESILRFNDDIALAVNTGVSDRSLLQLLASASALTLTAMAMMLVDQTPCPVQDDPRQGRLFPGLDADEHGSLDADDQP